MKVVILDATRMSAQLYAHVLADRGLEVTYAGDSCADASAVAIRSRADLALIRLAESDSVSQQLRPTIHFMQDCPNLKVVLLYKNASQELMIQAFRAGVRAVCCLNDAVDNLCQCLQAVKLGQRWVSADGLEWLIAISVMPTPLKLTDHKGLDLLSKREEEIVRCVCEGLTNAGIAEELKLSPNTVKNYLFKIFNKLGVSSRTELLRYVFSREQRPIVDKAMINNLPLAFH
jgi:two-component system nitrate/nitrite response regulator NarL